MSQQSRRAAMLWFAPLVFLALWVFPSSEASAQGAPAAEKLLRVRDYDKAIKAFALHLNNNPQDDRALALRAFCFWNKYRTKEARADIEAAMKLAPKNRSYLALRGLIGKDLREAKSVTEGFYTKALTASPTNGFEYYFRGLARVHFKQYESAALDFDKVAKLFDTFHDTVFYQGYCCQLQKQYKKAVGYYTKLIGQAPTYENAYYNRGRCQSSLKDFKAALSDFDTAIKLNGRYQKAYFERAYAHYDLANYAAAIKDFKTSLKLNSKHINSVYGWALALSSQKKNTEAIAKWNEYIKVKTSNHNAYIERGLCYYRLRNYDLAMKDYNKAAALNAKDYLVYYNRGLVHYRVAFLDVKQRRLEFDKALGDFELSIQLNSRYDKSLYMKGLVLSKLGRKASAKIQMEKCIVVNPKHYSAHIELGSILLGNRDRKAAIKEFSMAIMINPNKTIGFYNRAVAYEGLKLYKQAAADYKKVLSLDPNDPDRVKLKKFIAKHGN